MNYLLKLLPLICTMQLMGQNYVGNESDIQQILKNTENFSSYIMRSDYEMIGASYTDDAKIFPTNKAIIEGTTAIISYWQMPEGVSVIHHKVSSHEIKVLGNEAYDYGVYEGTTRLTSGEETSWKGKYVIVWKKINGTWLMYLDIWNRIP